MVFYGLSPTMSCAAVHRTNLDFGSWSTSLETLIFQKPLGSRPVSWVEFHHLTHKLFILFTNFSGGCEMERPFQDASWTPTWS